MERPQVLQDHPRIIIFDGVCSLCSGWVYFVSRRDPQKTFKFTPIQMDTGREILVWLGLPEEGVEMMVYVEGVHWYTKSSAFLRIVKKLRFPWPLLSVGIVIPRVIRDWIYDQIAAVRYQIFGKKEQCMLPDQELRSRFL